MNQNMRTSFRRREFLRSAVGSSIAAGVTLLGLSRSSAASQQPHLLAGEGMSDITPPKGVPEGEGVRNGAEKTSSHVSSPRRANPFRTHFDGAGWSAT
jgi:hypothetical protein